MSVTPERRYYTVDEWCQMNCIHRATFYREVAAGRLRIEKYGRKTLVPAGQELPTRLPMTRSATPGDIMATPGDNE